MQSMISGVEVESEIARSARRARETYTAGRAAGFELALVTAGHPEIADAFLLDLPAGTPYGTEPGQPTDGDWAWYLDRH